MKGRGPTEQQLREKKRHHWNEMRQAVREMGWPLKLVFGFPLLSLAWLFGRGGGGSGQSLASKPPASHSNTRDVRYPSAQSSPTNPKSKNAKIEADIAKMISVTGPSAQPGRGVIDLRIGNDPAPPIDAHTLVDFALEQAALGLAESQKQEPDELVSYAAGHDPRDLFGQRLSRFMASDRFLREFYREHSASPTPGHRGLVADKVLAYLPRRYGRDVAWRLSGPSTFRERAPDYPSLIRNIPDVIRSYSERMRGPDASAARPFSLEALHPEVREAAAKARIAHSDAETAALKAVNAALMAEMAAEMAARRSAGYWNKDWQDTGKRYLGSTPQLVDAGFVQEHIGVGMIAEEGSVLYAGWVRFARSTGGPSDPHTLHGVIEGAGVQFSGASVSFAGEWQNDEPLLGARFHDINRLGECYFGECARHSRQHGIRFLPNGVCEEGAKEFGARSPRVRWNSDGSILDAGVMEGGKFLPLAPQT